VAVAVAVAQFSSGGVESMTSRLAAMGATPKRGGRTIIVM